MNRTPVLLALTAALAVAPAALATGGGHHGSPDHPRPDRPSYDTGKDHTGGKDHKGDKDGKYQKGKHHKTAHLAHACVVEDATADGVDVRILSVNAHMRRALAGADTFTAKIDGSTTIRLVGRARHASDEGGSKRLSKYGDFTVLTAGDRVTVKIWDRRGTSAGDLRPAYKIIDHGASKRCGTPPPDCEAPDPDPEDPDVPPDTEEPAPEL